MLVLTRQPGQTIIIGDDITITVQAIKGNQVSVGISAPASVSIDREEVQRRKERLEDALQGSLYCHIINDRQKGIPT